MKLYSVVVFYMAVATTLAAPPSPSRPTPNWDKRWFQKHNYLSSLVSQASRKPNLDIYFLGDSITEFWPHLGLDSWKQEFGTLHVLNCGVSGDTTQNILYRITRSEFDRIKPRVVVLLAGINNLSTFPDLAPRDLARGIQEIVAVIRTKSPESKILTLSIFPAGDRLDPLRLRIKQTNECLEKIKNDVSVFYLDLHDRFLDRDGRMPPDVSPDGTHLNAAGYRIWADAMRPKLRALLEHTAQGEASLH